MVATTALSQKFFDLYPRIPERLELFPGLAQQLYKCPRLPSTIPNFYRMIILQTPKNGVRPMCPRSYVSIALCVQDSTCPGSYVARILTNS